MFYLIQILYTTFLLPPGIFLVILAALSIWLLSRDRKAAFGLAMVTCIFYLASTGLVSGALIRSLEHRHVPPAHINGDVIIMLGGGATLDTPNIGGAGHLYGSSANRLLTAVQLYQQLKVPIIVSGGKVLETTGNEAEITARTLANLGVPYEQIMIENKSLNTTQNAEFTKVLIDKHGFKKPILVTSAFHMERAVRQFSKAGQITTPFPTDYQVNVESRLTAYQLLPSAAALIDTQLAIKEYIGLLAARWY